MKEIRGIIKFNGLEFGYTITQPFTYEASCLSIYRAFDGVKQISINAPIFQELFKAIKAGRFNEFKDIQVEHLEMLTFRKNVKKGESFIMSDLAKL